MEKDLYLPIKEYFESLGYDCDGEVNKIDMFLTKADETVAVELKQTLNFKVIKQASLRQKVCDTVYIGTFMPKNMRSKDFNNTLYLLKRLGIGLVGVSKRTNAVSLISPAEISPLENFKARNRKNSKKIKSEFEGRTLRTNVGGVHGTKLITAYREKALLVLSALSALEGISTTKEVKLLSGVADSTIILYNNVYGWFENTEKGVYKLTEKGVSALNEYHEIIEKLHNTKEDL